MKLLYFVVFMLLVFLFMLNGCSSSPVFNEHAAAAADTCAAQGKTLNVINTPIFSYGYCGD